MRDFVSQVVYILLFATTSVMADGSVQGTGRYEKIKGHPNEYIELYEWNLYLAPDGGTSVGQSRRLGACSEYGGDCTAGYYQIEAADGWHTALITQPIFFARPTVVTDIRILDGQMATYNPELNLDYSCFYVADQAWSWGSPRYQTFEATGTSIIRIQWKLAGWHADAVQATIHKDNGGPITTWPQVGPAKASDTGYGDAWVGFRSGDIPTTPHHRYALKLTGLGGTPDSDFGIRSRIEDGNGYALGQAYDAAGNPENVDLLATIFSDNDGTVIPYIDMTPGNVETLGTGGTGIWGQSFQATEVALAAADCFITGDGTWDVNIEFRILENGPGGTQVGPTKIARSTYQAARTGIVGVSYARGEVPLTPGQTYYIEMSPATGSPAFAAYRFASQADNGYPYGHAYRNSVAQSNVDLEMTIIEYKPWFAPAIVNHSFEDDDGSIEGWNVTAIPGNGPDFPPLVDGAYGINCPDGDHFVGKVSSWSTFDFSLGQIIEVGDYDPTATETAWGLSAQVNLHSRSGATIRPENIHQLWEIGWNNDGSAPASVDRCDHYTTIADIDGSFTGNDDKEFYPLTLAGTINGIVGLKYIALRVRLFNDSPLEWSLNNIDDITFLAPPPAPMIELSPSAINYSIWIGDNVPNLSFNVINGGTDTMTYQLSEDSAWLSVTPATGSSSGEPDPIIVSFDDFAAMPAGDYTAEITVISDEAWNSPQTFPVTITVETVKPDFDGDGDVDQEDFGHFQRCYSDMSGQPTAAHCLNACLDIDEDVDGSDFALFQQCFSGANIQASSDCMD